MVSSLVHQNGLHHPTTGSDCIATLLIEHQTTYQTNIEMDNMTLIERNAHPSGAPSGVFFLEACIQHSHEVSVS